MKVILGLIAVLGLVGCATTQDPYAANHTAPDTQQRMPSSALTCDEVVPKCQLGDSYHEARNPASAAESCKQTIHECQLSAVPCKDGSGQDSTVETLDYGSKTQDCK